MATAAGALGVGGGLTWNMAVNASGGFVQTELNNAYYNEHKNVYVYAAVSGVAGGLGYLGGEKVTNSLEAAMPKSLVPIISGNIT